MQYGVVSGNVMDSLLQVMTSVYVPTFVANDSWPESVRKEFSRQLHKFMASLTESANHMKGHTVLYLPDEDLSNPSDKDLIQRLESTLIHWTRQIKEVVSNQETSHHVDNSGPLEEIEFWRSRCEDLSGIREQLDSPAVRNIVEVLKAAGSSYLKPFQAPADRIQAGALPLFRLFLRSVMALTLCPQQARWRPRTTFGSSASSEVRASAWQRRLRRKSRKFFRRYRTTQSSVRAPIYFAVPPLRSSTSFA